MKIATRLLPLFLLASCAAAPVAVPAPTATSTSPSGTVAVSAADPRAADAGRQMLLKGGSAVDAAIATMLALTVVEPQSSGVGGGSFLVYHDAKSGLATYDGREEAPSAATSSLFLGPDGTPPDSFEAARTGGRAVGVPGNLANVALAHRRHGKLPWATLFEPAIKLAQDGFQVTPRLHGTLDMYRSFLGSSAQGRTLYYQPDGSPKPVGSIIRNPDLARFLTEISQRGAAYFYKGPPAARLVEAVRSSPRNPGQMTVDDLAAYEAKSRPPLCGTYREYRICGMGPPSSGATAVYAILKQLERFDLASRSPSDPVAWHLIAESMRLAYADRAKWIADPDHIAVPTAGLMSDAYLARRAALISPSARMANAEPGTPAGAPKFAAACDSEVAGTSSFSVADAAGNVAAMTSTVEAPFGAGLVVDGYVLNNELTDFDIVPSLNCRMSLNSVGPGKRPRSSMAPTIVYDAQGRPVVSIGAAGGATIIAQVAKALIGVLDWKMSVQDAIAMPQLVAMGDLVRVEKGTSLEGMIPALERFGHKVQAVDLPLKANGVEWTKSGWRGGADPRSEGESLAFGQAVLEPK